MNIHLQLNPGTGEAGGALLTHRHRRRLLGTERPDREGRQKSGEPPRLESSSAAPGRGVTRFSQVSAPS